MSTWLKRLQPTSLVRGVPRQGLNLSSPRTGATEIAPTVITSLLYSPMVPSEWSIEGCGRPDPGCVPALIGAPPKLCVLFRPSDPGSQKERLIVDGNPEGLPG